MIDVHIKGENVLLYSIESDKSGGFGVIRGPHLKGAVDTLDYMQATRMETYLEIFS